MQTSPSPSPPDFDFNLPCRYFKSSFARSLSMHNGGAGLNDDASDMQCKSLDFDIGPYRKISTFNNNSSSSINNNNNSNNDIQNIDTKSLERPPLPQRRPTTYTTATTTSNKNEAASKHVNTNKNNSNNNMAYYESDLSDESIEEDVEKPPAIPARCPIVVPKSKSAGALNLQLRQQPQTQMQQQQQQQQQQKQHHQLLAQFRHVAISENANASGNAVAGAGTTTNAATAVNAAHANFNRPINHNKQHQPQRQQQQQQHQQHLNSQAKSNHSANNNNNNNDSVNSTRIGKSRCNLSNRRNVWPTDRDASQQQQQHQQQKQEDNLLFDVEDDVHVEVDNNSDGCLMNATPPVAATRSTLTPHYAPVAAAATKTNIAVTPKAVARPTPPCIEQQQRLNAFKVYNDNATTTATATTTTNVQVVLLQNQVDTLQWQLKQMETSNEMYRAVIEEIARFLDRYLTQKQQQPQLQQQQQQISRSKSLFQVYDGNNSNCEGHEENTNGDIDTFNDKSIGSAASSSTSTACLRTRSTSNLITDLKHATTKPSNTNTKHTTLATTVLAQKRSCDAINTYNNNNNNSYTAFKDFTWRRSPKKCAESKALAAANEVEEKLNKEAFRLSRTVQNLLNTSTGQPDLTQHRAALATPRTNTTAHSKLPQVLAPQHTATPTIPTPSQTTAHSAVNGKPNATSENMNRRVLPPHNTKSFANSHSTAEMLFLRANNIRDSRISLRSSTDSSVHSTISNSSVVSSSSSSAASTSSGKVETDDDITLHHPFHAAGLPFKQIQHPLSSATEDESGFSSISSFQDIGVPLCSTMISNGTSTPNRLSLASVKLDSVSLSNGSGVVAGDGGGGSLCDMESNEFVGGDSRNSTLKANHPSNVLGVPLQTTHDMQHRWDTTSTTTTKINYRSANKYQRFSTLSNEDAAAVLWV